MLKFALSADAVCPSINWDIETTVILHNDAFLFCLKTSTLSSLRIISQYIANDVASMDKSTNDPH